MCGIMGFYAFANRKPDKSVLSKMFALLQSRGTDASGYAFIQDGQLCVNKAPLPSSELIKTSDWQDLVLPSIMIFHTRLQTQGDASNNVNNHPLFSRSGLCIVHNGHIYNDDSIIGANRLTQVDSEAILSVMDSHPSYIRLRKVFERLIGAFAFASIETDNPDKLILVKHNNPIELYYDSGSDILYFCSERWIMQKALRITSTVKRGFTLGEDNFYSYSMENDTAIIIGKHGVEFYEPYSQYSFEDDMFSIECPVCMNVTNFNIRKPINKCNHCNHILKLEELNNVFPEN